MGRHADRDRIYYERNGLGYLTNPERLDYDEASIRAREQRTAQVKAEIQAWRREQVAKGGKLIGGIWVYPDTPEEEAVMRETIERLERELAEARDELAQARADAEDHCARADEAERERDILRLRLVELEPAPPAEELPTLPKIDPAVPAVLTPMADQIAAELNELLSVHHLADQANAAIAEATQKAAAPLPRKRA